MKRLILLFSLISSTFAAQPPVTTCVVCHGSQGISSTPQWPNLAGQHVAYLIKQMHDMQKGARQVPAMTAVLQHLTTEEIEDLASYYATMPHAPTPSPVTSLRGEQLYKNGDLKKRINACSICHGPTGLGNAQAGFPALNGQNAQYLIMQLHAFKEGTRTNDLYHVMQDISKHMNDEEIEAVANYIQGLH